MHDDSLSTIASSLRGVVLLTLLIKNTNVTHSCVIHGGYVVSLYTETATYYKNAGYRKQSACEHLCHKILAMVAWSSLWKFSYHLIIMQNLVTAGYTHTVWAHAGGPKELGGEALDWSPLPWDKDRAWPCWNTTLPAHVIIPRWVGLAQTLA